MKNADVAVNTLNSALCEALARRAGTVPAIVSVAGERGAAMSPPQFFGGRPRKALG